MAAYAGTIANLLAGALAWALLGPLWGGIVFLAVAVVRMALEVQSLRAANAELTFLIARSADGSVDEYDEAPVESEMRPRISSIPEVRAVGTR